QENIHVTFATDIDDLDQVIVEKDSECFFTRLGFIPTQSDVKIEIPNFKNLKGNLNVKSCGKNEDILIVRSFIQNSLYVIFHSKKHIGKFSACIVISDENLASFKIKLMGNCIDIRHGKPALKRGVHVLKT
ncbi:hypothetical protein MXB_4941, partial [Myxobolus squamalis]